MTARPRSHDRGTDDPEPPRRGDGDGVSPLPRRVASSLAEAEQFTMQVAQQGRAGEGRNVVSGDGPPAAPARTPDDPDLAHAMRVYEQLGADPPKIDVALNDAAHSGAHTLERHSPDIPLRQQPGVQTIEGRIYGDHGWTQPENQSFKWDNPSVMTREINDYVERNWETIRSDLATDSVHEGRYKADRRVGEGFLNGGMYGFGPRHADYVPTSLVRLRIRLVPGADPAQPFLVSAFPAGIL